MIDLNDITIRIAGKILLQEASVHIPDDKKVGLVGLNGCGKTTLFKAIQNEISLETGSITKPSSSRLVYMAQEITNPQKSALNYILDADTERTSLLKQLETASGMELSNIYDRLALIGADSAPARACRILNGLGFSETDMHKKLSDLSGGWRMRVALAATLFQPSDILLLDEPTNHLDLESSIWLLGYLQKYKGTLLLISHDKSFLNELCNMIVHFEAKKLYAYNGNYDTYQRTRAEQQNLQQKTIEKQEKTRQHIQSFVDRFRYKATKAKQAQSRLKQLEKLKMNVVEYENTSSHFEFPAPYELVSPIMKIEGASTGYQKGQPILQNMSLQIDKDDRIALLGANGNGKSTFAKLLSGQLELFDGNITASKKLSVGYFAQNQSEELPLHITPVSYIADFMKDANETKIRTHLACFCLEGQKAITQIDKLSGGEKARLLLAKITCNKPNFLILDEPTNHLDIQAREALIDALNTYTGAVILITHDLHLIEMVADKLWLVDHGTCTVFHEDIETYRKMILDKNKTPVLEKTPNKITYSSKERRQQNAQKLAKLKPIKDEIKKLEQLIKQHNRRTAEIEALFAQNLTAAQMIELQKEFRTLQTSIQNAENRWLELSEELEANT